jgi:two-component system OmpR family sensor kinase
MNPTGSSPTAWPLRRLLLAAYVGLLGAALLSVSLGIRVLVGRFLDHAEEQTIRQTCEEAWVRLGLPDAEFWGSPPRGALLLPRSPALGQMETLVRDLARPERHVRWRDARADVVIQAGGRPVEAGRPAPPSPHVQWWGLTMHTREGHLGTLEIGLDRRDDYALLAALGRYLFFCSLAVLCLAVLLCSRLSTYWLAPLKTLADTLERLAEGDLSARPPEITGALVPSEWGRLRQSADDMANRLDASFTAQRRFISDASHELRTPLTSVAAMAEMLEDGDIGAEGRAKAQSTILRESRRMSRLVEDLLALSRADEGRPLAAESCQLQPILQSLLEEFSEVSPQRAIEVSCPDDVVVDAPLTLVRTVLRNLLENALRYSDGPVVCRVAQRGGAAVEISVEDQGCGIPENEISRVFERFYRADHSRSRATGGSGLGLAIVKSLVDRTGGEISLRSQLDVGTTVQVVWKGRSQ